MITYCKDCIYYKTCVWACDNVNSSNCNYFKKVKDYEGVKLDFHCKPYEAEWIKKEIIESGDFCTIKSYRNVCSNCGIVNVSKYKNYCPNCGYRMFKSQESEG